MNGTATDSAKIAKLSSSMGGVFSSVDLKNLLNETNNLKLNRRIRRLQRAGTLTRFSRGIYITVNATLDTASARVYDDSYVSLASALARHLMIGTIPARTVYAVSSARTQTFLGPLGKIVYVGARPELIFGFEIVNGIKYATPEKALIDTLYYYQKGRRYYFDIFSDINISVVNEATILSYLTHYNNPRFVAFVKGYLNDRISR